MFHCKGCEVFTKAAPRDVVESQTLAVFQKRVNVQLSDTVYGRIDIARLNVVLEDLRSLF